MSPEFLKKTSFVKKTCDNLSATWWEFWFTPQDARLVSLYRIILATGFFLYYLPRQFDYAFLFSNQGVLPFDRFAAVVPGVLRTWIPLERLASIDSLGFFLHLLFLLLLLLLAFGVVGRAWTWLIFILHLVFIHRNPMVLYGPDMVGTFFLGYLAFMDCTRYFSIRGKKSGIYTDPATSLGVRLVQVQVCVIYAYSGLDKAKGVTWWQGDALWRALANAQIARFNLDFLYHFPLALIVGAFLSMAWEVYFPVAIWIPRLRPWVLLFGFLFHLLIALTMNIAFFSWFMCATYILFLQPTQAGWLFKRMKWEASAS